MKRLAWFLLNLLIVAGIISLWVMMTHITTMKPVTVHQTTVHISSDRVARKYIDSIQTLIEGKRVENDSIRRKSRN